MALTATDIVRLVEEWVPLLVGARVDRVFDDERRHFIVTFGVGGRLEGLVLALRAPVVRAHLVERLPKPNPEPHPVAAVLHAHLAGALCESIRVLEGERIVEMAFSAPGGPRVLVAELFSRRGDLYLLGTDRAIIACTARREPGTAYEPPTRGAAPQPSAVEAPRSGSFNAEVAARFEALEAAADLDERRRALIGHLRRESKRLARLVERLTAERAECENWPRQQHLGELLKTHLREVRPRQTELTVEDYLTGGPTTIALDPRARPQQNMEAYFARARKWRSAIPHLDARLGEARSKCEAVAGLISRVETAASAEDLDAVLSASHLRLKPPQARPARREAAAVSPRARSKRAAESFRYFVGTGGAKIYVGRDDDENDRLTFSFARGADLWLHAMDYPGSHIVVRRVRGSPVDLEVLRDAATLALAYSKAKSAGAGDVMYTERKFLSKPKGLAPGKVSVSKHKVIHISLDPERMRRLKEATETVSLTDLDAASP